ncbi:MAG TPA: hypothetical protein VFA59_24575 [Vicinamibacterales bacterium]|nr:hypothetical protein [Vicinamibacterales bacterium]
MMFRLALRSLTTRPLRSAVLAAGFGLGIGVMVELLGVGEVILEQSHAPALRGGGDVVVSSDIGPLTGARFLLADVLGSPRYRDRVRVASPSRRTTLYLVQREGVTPVAVRAGVPSLERGVGDPEIASQLSWTDAPGDAAWVHPAREEILRALDRFHTIPPSPSIQPLDSSLQPLASSLRSSWAEWLYFNGRSADLRFYLSFIAGGLNSDGTRTIGVRLQLDRNGTSTSYVTTGGVANEALLANAPNITVGGNRVRLEGSQYHITLNLPGVTGELVLDAAPGRSLPPAVIQGADNWISGYVVPVLAGTFRGHLVVDGQSIAIANVAGYHDHNWGFWEGVRWQWGQVSNGDLSIVYGRVFPPASVADPDRIPGFLGILAPDGPLAFSTNVAIDEDDERGAPRRIRVRAHGADLDVALQFDVSELERTTTFLQLGGVYEVKGRARDREIRFTARGSAETFRPPTALAR